MQRYIKSIVILSAFLSSSSYADPVSDLESTVNKWLAIEQQSSELEGHWIEKKASMEQTLALLDAEQEQLKELNKNRKENNDELASKREELIKQQNSLENDEAVLSDQLVSISQKLQSLLVQLPPPLKASWQTLGSLSDESLTATEKLQLELKMLEKLEDFQNRISIHEMAITNSKGKEIWVKQLYLGAAQAWFVSNDLSYVGIGYPSKLGWQWKFDPNIDAHQVEHGIKVQQKKQSPKWLTLPVFSYAKTEVKP